MISTRVMTGPCKAFGLGESNTDFVEWVSVVKIVSPCRNCTADRIDTCHHGALGSGLSPKDLTSEIWGTSSRSGQDLSPDAATLWTVLGCTSAWVPPHRSCSSDSKLFSGGYCVQESAGQIRRCWDLAIIGSQHLSHAMNSSLFLSHGRLTLQSASTRSGITMKLSSEYYALWTASDILICRYVANFTAPLWGHGGRTKSSSQVWSSDCSLSFMHMSISHSRQQMLALRNYNLSCLEQDILMLPVQLASASLELHGCARSSWDETAFWSHPKASHSITTFICPRCLADIELSSQICMV